MPTLSEDLQRILAEAPTTANELADHLAALGIRGVAGSSTQCPLARWLKGELGKCQPNEYVTVHVSGDFVWAYDLADDMSTVFMTTGQREFVRRLDSQGDFPDLHDDLGIRL